MAKDKNLINDACTNAAYRLMEIDYNDDPKFWIERVKIEYDGNMQRYNAKSDEEKKDKIIRFYLRNYKDRIKTCIKSNFGLSDDCETGSKKVLYKGFDLEDYEQKDLEDFFIFYIKEILDSEKKLLRGEQIKKGELSYSIPNRNAGKKLKSNEIELDYEKYFDYIIQYRNEMLRINMTSDTIDDYRKNKNWYWSAKERIRNIDGKDALDIWEQGLEIIEQFIKDDMMMDNGICSYFEIGKNTLECLLTLVDEVFRSKYWNQQIINILEKYLDGAFEAVQNTMKEEFEEDFNQGIEEKDVFKEYAIMYYLGMSERESQILIRELEKLYELTTNDTRKGYIIELDERNILPLSMSDSLSDQQIEEILLSEETVNKFTKMALCTEKGRKYDGKRVEEKFKTAKQLCKCLNKAMYTKLDFNNPTTRIAMVEEIYDCDKILDLGDGFNTYNMEKIAHDMVKGKYEENHNRNAEVFILNEKINRGIDIRTYPKEHYLQKNKLQQFIYDIEKKIFDERKHVKKYIYKFPVYWLLIIQYLRYVHEYYKKPWD